MCNQPVIVTKKRDSVHQYYNNINSELKVSDIFFYTLYCVLFDTALPPAKIPDHQMHQNVLLFLF